MGATGDRPPLQRETIISTARDLIVAHGLDALSLRRLASELGVTAPALYAHVADKQDLLRSIAEQELDQLVERFESVEATDPIARIHAYARCYLEYSRESPELYRVMFLFPPDLGPASPAPGRELPAATKAFSAAAGAIDDAINAGLLVADDPLLVSLTIWSGMYGLAGVLQLGFDLPPEMVDALMTEVIDRILRGYGAPAAS